ncbi:Pre-mRNA-splicing factor CWC2 [Rhodotorula diobovata]|uniref:Pre-mRNA-splicing factor CWC2 n=1 Tax=Rhodotorula diobovata TaxID=5288 RepID=A0A5C5FYM4_9BASI|nr:Pre-mRNA-splicing factor CWC2 [Rhodotorula diobovata]
MADVALQNDAPQQQPAKKRMVKRKPARKQVEEGQIEPRVVEQTGQTYNLWYHKWAGGDKYDAMGLQQKAQTRVSIKNDAGYTRADGSGNKYICLYFARGCCPKGVECTYLHRLPPAQHVLPDASLDVFGREKHSGYRDDMGGVGSFNRQNRTLYIGRLRETRDTAEVVEEHFAEFGEIERIKILTNRGVAFVTYTNELNAQFAKEAMMHQSLENDEVLNVRWATEDPNPAAARKEKARLVAEGERGVAKALDPEFVQRVRELDELEGRVGPREDADAGAGAGKEEEDEGAGRGKKRARIEPPPGATIVEEQAHNANAAPPPPPPLPAPAPAAGGILSAHAVDSLRYMAHLRQQKTGAPAPAAVAAAAPAKAKPAGLGALAAYGSDDESD